MKKNAERRLQIAERWVLSALCALLSTCSFAADPTAPRLFFSDAKISFTLPNRWQLQPQFPYGPLFTKTTQDGSVAQISCAISAPLNNNRISEDISQEILKQLARRELETRQPGYKAISERDRQLARHNAYEITWENKQEGKSVTNQTLYFFVEDRIYALTLQASARTFRWAAMDFQNWLGTVRILSRKDSGSLENPSHGGIWIHQTAGAKIAIPEPWLVAVADDRMLGITLAEDNMQAAMTATLSISSPTPSGFSKRDKKEAIKALRRKGLRIVRDVEEPFHGFPAFQVEYEGHVEDRVVKGRDIWVLSPKARWLLNLEGDVALYNSLKEHYDEILKSIEFI